MTPSEKNILKSLIAVAWADGTVKEPEIAIIDGLLWAFGAEPDEEAEIREFSSKKRTLKDDIPLDALSAEDRTVLLAHAALMTHADGKQTKGEEKLLTSLAELLGVPGAELEKIAASARDRAKKLASRL